jgi:hypothetical protein
MSGCDAIPSSPFRARFTPCRVAFSDLVPRRIYCGQPCWYQQPNVFTMTGVHGFRLGLYSVRAGGKSILSIRIRLSAQRFVTASSTLLRQTRRTVFETTVNDWSDNFLLESPRLMRRLPISPGAAYRYFNATQRFPDGASAAHRGIGLETLDCMRHTPVAGLTTMRPGVLRN